MKVKRMISLWLCLLMLAALPMSALAAEGDVLLPCGAPENAIPEYILSSHPVGNALYLFGMDGGLYAVAPGAPEPRAYALAGDLEAPQYGCLLARGEQPMLLNLSTDGTQSQAALYALELEGGTARAAMVGTVDLGGGYAVERALSLGDTALLVVSQAGGVRELRRLNLADGSTAPSQCDIGAIYAAAPYTGGRALLCEARGEDFRFLAYDPAADAVEVLGEVDRWYGALACDPATGAAYCARDGEIYPLDLATGALGDAVAAAPASTSPEAAAWILPSGHFAFAYMDTCALVGLDPAGFAQARRLTIVDESSVPCLDSAYYAFSNERGDVTVTLSHADAGDLVGKMLSQDASADIYVLPTSHEAFAAARDRGYMADLTQNPALAALAERLHPGLREALSSNGAFAALPVEAVFWQMRVNENALAKLGRTLDDVPRNWSDFVDFLIELQADFPQDGSLTLMGADVDEIEAREAMFFAIFDAYQRMVLDDPDSVDAQAMVDILTRLEQVDFTRFGQPAAERSEGDGTTAIAGAAVAAWGPADYDPDSVLLTMYSGGTLAAVEDAEGTMMVMSLKPDAPARLEMECYVAFVNPYSENLDLALAFMETLAENLPDEVLYAICADLTEPVPDPNYEERLANAQAELERARQELAEADEIDRQALEDSVARIERYIADMESEQMLISEGEIAWLRANAGGLALEGQNWLYADESGEAYALVRQYCDGRIDAQRLMDGIDGKIRMMILEQA